MVFYKIASPHYTSTSILTKIGYHTVIVKITKEDETEKEPSEVDLYRDKSLPKWMKRR